MLRLIQTKILLAILAALSIIASAAIYRSYNAHKITVLHEEELRRDGEFRKHVEQDKKQHNSAASDEGKTWRSYVP